MNIMIELNNIKKTGDIISADIKTVELEPRYFKVSVNIKTKKMVECTSEIFDMYASGAVAKLFNLYIDNGDKLPKKAQAVWY